MSEEERTGAAFEVSAKRQTARPMTSLTKKKVPILALVLNEGEGRVLWREDCFDEESEVEVVEVGCFW